MSADLKVVPVCVIDTSKEQKILNTVTGLSFPSFATVAMEAILKIDTFSVHTRRIKTVIHIYKSIAVKYTSFSTIANSYLLLLTLDLDLV